MRMNFVRLGILLLTMAGVSAGAAERRLAFGFPGGAGEQAAAQAGSYFEGCPELGDYLREMIEQGYAQRPVYMAMQEVAVDFSAQPSSAPDDSGELSYSETNVQEAGVDEADIVKSDGEFFYIANAGYFSIARAYPPQAMELLFERELEGVPQGLFVYDGLAVVISSVWQWEAAVASMGFAPYSNALTKLELFDVDDPSEPQLLRELYLEGSFNTARRIGSQVHLVVDSWLHNYYTAAPLVQPAAYSDRNATVSSLLRFSVPAARAMEGLVPRIVDHRYAAADAETAETRPMTACNDYLVPPEPGGANTLTILTLDLEAPLEDPQSTSLITDYGTVYASADNLYVAVMHSEYWAFMEAGSESTILYRFALGEKALLEAQGEVPGTIINRYSLGEHQGYLRVATTLNQWGWGGEEPLNTLYVLDADLEPVGELPDLGHDGERIYAVRFDGSRGYVVTFRQVDPLYTLDLSDPLQPKALGELEVPGFSTYLHPVGEDRVLGIGRNPADWSTELSLYDVGDFAEPGLVDRVNLGSGSWSEALYEPKAFTWFAPAETLVVPVQVYPQVVDAEGNLGNEPFNGAVVWRVDLEQGFEYRGVVDHRALADEWGYAPSIRRSLFVGQGGDFTLYTLSNSALQAVDAEDVSYQEGFLRLPVAGQQFWID